MKKIARLRYFAALLYWKIFKPVTLGVKAMVVSNNSVLLAKQSYQDYWSLPGGGVEFGESVFEAAARELSEETGITIPAKEFQMNSVHFSHREHKSDHVLVLYVQVTKMEEPSIGSELSDAKWFDLENLPADVSPATQRRIYEQRSGKQPDISW